MQTVQDGRRYTLAIVMFFQNDGTLKAYTQSYKKAAAFGTVAFDYVRHFVQFILSRVQCHVSSEHNLDFLAEGFLDFCLHDACVYHGLSLCLLEIP